MRAMRWTSLVAAMLAACSSAATRSSVAIGADDALPGASQGADAESGLARPIWIENRGQWPEQIQFAAQLPGCLAWVERGAIALSLEGRAGRGPRLVRLVFEGAEPATRWEGASPLEGRYHYFLGDDPERWTRNARTFGELRCEGLYSGIEFALRPRGRSLKYDLIVAAGADLKRFAIRCEGVESIGTTEDGKIEFDEATDSLIQLPGASWQLLPDGRQRSVQPRWMLDADGRWKLDVPGYDPALPLVVDPELVWSTYLGGATGSGQGDIPGPVALGPDGDAYFVGRSDGFDFPQLPGTFHERRIGAENVFITRLRASDGALIYSSILGGDAEERGLAVCVDDLGRGTVGGWTLSPDFPVTPGAFDSKDSNYGWNGFVTRLTALGDELSFSTLIEGVTSGAQVLAVESATDGSVLVGGVAYGADFPVTPGALQTTWEGGVTDGFVLELDPTGSSLAWSTFLGGTSTDRLRGLGIGLDGTVTATGETGSHDFPTTPQSFQPDKLSFFGIAGFATRIRPDGSALVWSSFLGGSEFLETIRPYDLALDALGTVCIVGETNSPSFPTTPGAVQEQMPGAGGGFATRFAADGSALLYSTYLSSSSGSVVYSVAGDASGVFTVAGTTPSGFPVTPGAFDTEETQGAGDFFVGRIRPDGRRLFYATYLGGIPTNSNSGVASDPSGRVTVAGYVDFPGGYPTTPEAPFPEFIGGQTDGAITTFDLLLDGVSQYGSSTPSCLGPVRIGVTEMPVAGAARFGLYASGAPPDSTGELLVSLARAAVDDTASPDVLRWVDPGRLLARVPLASDAFGYAEADFPLRSDWVGWRLYAQFVFNATPDCPAPAKECASFALELEVQ